MVDLANSGNFLSSGIGKNGRESGRCESRFLRVNPIQVEELQEYNNLLLSFDLI